MLNPVAASRIITVTLCATLLHACASLEWHRPGATDAELQRDLDECMLRARSDARQLAPQGIEGPHIITGRDGQVVAVPPQRRDSERFLLESDLTRQCMTSRGYFLRDKPLRTSGEAASP